MGSGVGKELLDPTSKHYLKMDKLDLIKSMNLFSVKAHVKRIKKKSYGLGKIFANHTFDKRLVSRTYKDLSKLNNKKIKLSN